MSDSLSVEEIKRKICDGIYKTFERESGEGSSQASSDNVENEGPPAAKKQRFDVCDFEDDDVSVPSDVDEVTAYLQARADSTNRDVLLYWQQNSQTFPKLATLARQVFAIPASSAASERSFSAAGFTVSERRTGLNPDTVDNILFVHANQ